MSKSPMNNNHEWANLLQRQKSQQIADRTTFCDNCLRRATDLPTALKRCVGCKCVSYCSKDCQKAHWPNHKNVCHLIQKQGERPANTFLSVIASLNGEDYMICLLIDSYRLRVENDHIHKHEDHGIYYNGTELPFGSVFANGDVEADFQNYLDCAEKACVLPKWFEFYKRMECLTRAVDRKGNAENIYTRIDPQHLPPRYDGDYLIISTLILLADMIVGVDGKGPSEGRE